MNTILKNIVRFAGLVVGVPVALPHKLNVNGEPVAPQIVVPNVGGITIVVDDVNVTATRQAGAPAAVDVYVEHWHTIESVTPPGNLVGFVPFVVEPGFGSGSGTNNPMAPPAQWFFGAIDTPSTPPTPLFMRPSDAGNTVEIELMRSGSIVGIAITLIDLNTGLPGSVTGGTLTFLVTLGGVPVLAAPISGGSGTQVTAALGAVPYAAGALLGVAFNTDAGYTADTDQLYAFVWVQTFETAP